MTFKTHLSIICLSILLILSTNFESSANNNNVKANAFTYSGKFTFLDGTPIMRGIDTDDFSLDLDRAPDLYAAYVKEVKDGNITFLCSVSGKYTLKFMGIEIAKFEVTEQGEEFSSNLPDHLSFPFNFIAITKPNSTIKIYDDNINVIETIVANEEGYAALKGNEQFFSNKFIITEAKDHFPNPVFFKEIKPRNKGILSYRKVRPSTQPIKAKRGLVHNISTDTYFTKREIAFTKDEKIALLFVYEAKDQKITISKLNLTAYPKATLSELILDELGRPVINLKKRFGSSSNYEYQSLIVSKNGNLQVDDETFVYPTYRFKNNFVKGTRWILSTFKDIALTEGNHELKISCNGGWTEPNPAAEAHRQLAGEIADLVAEIDKAQNENRDIGNSKSLLLDEKREQLRNMPPAPPFKRSGSLSSSESFNVFLSPFADQLWKMTSSLDIENGNVDSIAYNVKCVKTNPAVKAWNERRNKITSNRSLDPKARQEAMESLGKFPTTTCLKYDSTAYYYTRRYRPSGYDPESDLAIKNIGITDCIIELDGNAFDYSYKDLYGCRGISYMDFDSDEDRKEAAEACFRNAPVNMGFEGEMESGYDGWGKNIDLFDKSWNLISNEPINSWEGPYPELRYGFREILGQYASMKEAREHCKSPRYNNRNKKYECYEEKVITICFDNYQFSVDENGRIQTNYDALYCGEMDPEESNLKGDQIVVEFSAKGYLTTTRALEKRILEADNILLSGHVTDKDGIEIDSAQIKLKGIDGAAVTDETGTYHLTAKAQGEESYSEVMDIKLQKITIEINHEELGEYEEDKPFGLVSDGFTTLKLKIKAKGIRPQTVIVKQPELGSFVEQSMLKIPLVLDANGEGEMEYVPPTYLKNEDLSKKLETPKLGKLSLPFLWVAEVPIQFTYEDEEGNPGTFEMNIFVTRPPVLPIHGFTGDLSTWANLATYLRDQKYNFILREYYEGPADESTIQRQSQKLGQYIQETQKAYKESRILQTRVDIVAHSMGGLISRHYISNMAKYGEKAGIVIPYNVKLSRDELAAQRFKTPVKLNDIRKLIMVGTPNHGATWIDGRIGYLGAYMADVHEVANSQLRSNSQFLANLNAGENQGRHLAPNVQYALLYGRRRLRSFYPPDYLKYKYTNPIGLAAGHVTDDDGVVRVSSAKLNGIIDFAFPQKINNPYGFIHSPALSFPFSGEKSITSDSAIFDKINELLLEDIPRMPLKNSFAKVFGTEGDVSMRYYSTEAWKPMATGTSKKLDNYWSQFKTGEGRTRVAFFLNNYHWGSIHIEPNTILRIENASPELVEVYLQQGKARFTSRKQQGGGFEIAMGEETEKWYNFNPKAVVVDINTDFIIDKDESIIVQSIDGNVSVGFADEKVENMKGKKIETNGGIEFTPFGEMIDSPLPDSGWWSNIDITYLADETLESVGEIIIQEDFSDGYSNWDTTKIVPELIDEKMYWNVGEYNSLTHNTPIPLQNVIIEFDGWTDKNSISLEWFNADIKGYNVAIGAYFNTKSALGFKDKDQFEFEWFPGAHLKLGLWHHYKYVVSNDKLEAYLDGSLIGSKTIYQQIAGKGKLSFFSYQSRVGIDNIQVYRGSSTVLSIAQLSQQNLLINGSFEEGPNVNSYLTMRTGVTIPGWRVSRETVDLTGSYFQASDGVRSIDLVGTPGLGAIEQVFQTIIGKNYRLTFDMAGNPVGGASIKPMMVSVAGQSTEFEFDVTGKGVQDMGWKENTLIFTAIDEKTTLTFTALAAVTSSNYGAAIDNVKVVEYQGEFTQMIVEQPIEIPIQNLGEVDVRMQVAYLPISGFTKLQIQAKNDMGEVLESPYEVKVKLENKDLLPFINITGTQEIINELGSYESNITISEPNIDIYNSLIDIPLEATFTVQLLHPRTKEVQFEKTLTLPIGMTLLRGQTIGPDYQPRQQPLPPEFYGTSYQIANQTDENGNFFILFNTTLFDKDVDRFKKLAERTQQIFSMDQFDFSIQWSDACSLPLKYVLGDNIKSQLLPANTIKIGRNGLIDLLSPEEQEQRILHMTTLFVEKMPLKPEKKSFILSKLKRLIFRYGTTTLKKPGFTDILTFSNVIEAPGTRNGYWSGEMVLGSDDPPFTSMMHVMGHFLHQAISLTDNRYYDFLAKSCNGSEKLWTHQMDLLKYMFDKSEYISFSEAGADFFNYLMFKFIEEQEKDFLTNSIYYHPGYLNQFSNSNLAMDAKLKFPNYAVSGSQTAFLVEYYGYNCENNPSGVFADFIFNQLQYAAYTNYGEPASTINEWLTAKQRSYQTEYIVTVTNPFQLASQYALVNEKNISLVPIGKYTDASAEINGNIVSDFSQIPTVNISVNSVINIIGGKFNLIIPSGEGPQIIVLEPTSRIRIGESFSIELLAGNIHVLAPVSFQIPLAKVVSTSSDFRIKLEPGLTTISVFEGEVSIISENDDEIIRAGNTTTMNKKGRIKKSKTMKEIPVQTLPKVVEAPFRVYR